MVTCSRGTKLTVGDSFLKDQLHHVDDCTESKGLLETRRQRGTCRCYPKKILAKVSVMAVALGELDCHTIHLEKMAPGHEPRPPPLAPRCLDHA